MGVSFSPIEMRYVQIYHKNIILNKPQAYKSVNVVKCQFIFAAAVKVSN